MAKKKPEGMTNIAMQHVAVNAADIYELIVEGLYTDGGHHKQWYLREVGLKLGFHLPTEDEDENGFDPGIPG